jgi:hypothetical protein
MENDERQKGAIRKRGWLMKEQLKPATKSCVQSDTRESFATGKAMS